MIKSKAHWDWESGYGNMEVPIVIPNSKSNHTTKIVVTLTIVIMVTVFLSTL